MRSFVIIMCLIISSADAQKNRGHQQDHSGWDIRLAVPGEPGNDYPTLGAIPRTTFSCAGREPGYYADLETNCQVFRVCTVGSTYGFQSFLCPNGTLFNQAVVVCDWWMNVNCQDSQQLSNSNNEQFENLRLGPQLMKDIKKMLTYPMRNPYDKTSMRSHQIVMQDYKPPSGQLFPNGALLAGPERAPNNVYVPAKQIQQNYGQNSYTTTENVFSISTPEPRYIPAAFSSEQPSVQRDIEVFQRQQQAGQYIESTQNLQSENLISNGHAIQFNQNKNSDSSVYGNSQSKRPNQRLNQVGVQQYTQRQASKVNTQTVNSQNSIHSPRGQLRQSVQYSDNKQRSHLNSANQIDDGVSLIKQQHNYNSNQDNQPYTYRPPLPRFSNSITDHVGNEFKENLVSTIEAAPSTIVTKTVPFNRIIQEPKLGKPKSRITVKTWIVSPSKSARLIAEPTSYVYNRPTPTENIIDNTTPYHYNKPTAIIQRERISEPELRPYVYNKPTVSSRQIIATSSEPTRSYLSPTPTLNPRPTLSSRLNLKPTLATPMKASRVNLAPTTFKPSARLYLPPSENIVSRQYLSPSIMEQSMYYQNSQLRSPSTTPLTSPPSSLPRNENKNDPSFTITKHSRINANHNNLTFADILTKEKLDITVNDIVKDTDTILQTASPERFEQYRQDVKSVDFPAQNPLPTEAETESGENLTSQTPTTVTKTARLIAPPSMSLEPPIDSHNIINKNQLSNLPYFKEPAPTNTIERTVSLKISIPEKLAAYLFNNQNENDFDSLEILNSGSSNYLVLTNPILNKRTKSSFIPLGRLIGNKNNNISNSQGLVYSFLADSINVAKEYSNIIQQESLPTTPATQFKNLNNEELARITNNISQLTSSQYSGTDKINNNAANTMPTTQTNNTQDNQYKGYAKYSTPQQIQPLQYIKAPSQPPQNQVFTTQFQNNGFPSNVLTNNNENKIYSGQLYQVPVPDVTSQIYNRQSSANLIQPSNLQHSTQTANPLLLNQNSNVANNNNLVKQSDPQVEIVQSRTLPLNPAKLQLESPNQPESFNSQETFTNFLNSDNGISAQLQDKIVGTIPHPLDENKLLTYKKDQSYYLFTKFENNDAERKDRTDNNLRNDFSDQQSAKVIQSNVPNLIAFQLIPSVSYELEDEREQQKFLNTFQIDEFGAPRNLVNSNQKADSRQDNVLTTNIDYTIEHPTSTNQVDGRFNNNNALYAGQSSYSAPQSSVGNLELRQMVAQNSRLEQFNENPNSGYTKMVPARQFSF